MFAVTFWYGARLAAYDLQHNCTNDCMNGGIVVSVLMCFMFGTLGLSQVRVVTDRRDCPCRGLDNYISLLSVYIFLTCETD